MSPTSKLAPRVVLLVTIALFLCFLTNVLQHVVLEGDPRQIPLVVALALAIFALHVGVLGNPAVAASSARARVAAGAMAVLCVIGFILVGDPWDSMTALLTAAAFFVLPWVFGVLSIVATATVIAILIPDEPLMFAYVLAFQTIFGVGFFLLGRLRGAVLELDSARDALQGAALQHERLRLAQDLHDLFGLTLSAIVLKAELAKRLILAQPQRARGELHELGDLADHTLDDLLAVTSGAVRPDLDEELRTAAAVLSDAGATLTVRGDRGMLPPAIADTFALIVREAVANILRHSAARTVEVQWNRGASDVTLAIRNDGAAARSRTNGHGHRNLLARVQERGGSLAVVAAGDSFELVTRLPHRRTATLLAGAPRWKLVAVGLVVFAAEAAHTIFIIAETPHPVGVVVASAATTLLATALLARELITDRDPLGVRGAVLFAVIALLTFAPMLLWGDPFLGASGVAAAAALTLLPPRVRLVAFGLILVGMPVLHVVTGQDFFYVIWSIEVVIDHGLILFAILQLSAMVRQLEATRAQLAEIAVDQARLRFENDLDAVLRPGLAEISAKAASADEGVAANPADAAATVDALVVLARELVTEVRQVASQHEAG